MYQVTVEFRDETQEVHWFNYHPKLNSVVRIGRSEKWGHVLTISKKYSQEEYLQKEYKYYS